MTPRVILPIGRWRLAVVAMALAVTRCATVVVYGSTYYSYGMIAGQFAIAEAAYTGRSFAQDAALASAAMDLATREQRFVSIEEWTGLPRSGRYTTFFAQDLPGYGYLIAQTSRLFDRRLTTRYALLTQLVIEQLAVLLFVCCAAFVVGERSATLAGLAYAVGYPFIWPAASLPMRDIFAVATFATFIAAYFLWTRTRTAAALGGAVGLISAGSVLLWCRPSGYGYGAGLAVLALATAAWRRQGMRQAVVFSALAVLLPWLVFGYPYRLFNLRHYGVADTQFLGRVLWAHMGIVERNPYGFELRDEALVPWIKRHYGVDVTYGSVEMNRLLGIYAREVVRKDPAYYARSVAARAWVMAQAPLELVSPWHVAPFTGAGLTFGEYARRHPGAFAFKALSRVAVIAFFYGGIVSAAILAFRQRDRLPEHLVLLSPLLYTIAAQLPTAFEQRYMATGAWVLVLPWAVAIDALGASLAGQWRPGRTTVTTSLP